MEDIKPFAASSHRLPGGLGLIHTYYMSVEDRLRWVAGCLSTNLLRDALRVDGLQKTVRAAIERRLRKLEADS